jgi:oligopeptide/dipeptide ABC transporter ATP-binding protein
MAADMALLDISALDVGFRTEAGQVRVLHDVSLMIQPGEIMGVVGESGSGKSVMALSVMRLLGDLGVIERGRIALSGRQLLDLDPAAMRSVRGREIGMIFQEPMSSLNPLLSIGFQIGEVLSTHLNLTGRAARARGIELLQEVGLPAAASRYDDHPHALSGGQRQRVMIAMAMACRPRLLIADEPTTALDVTIQAQILALMRNLRRDHGSAILLITHDMGVIAQTTDTVAVMYAGEVVEIAPTRALMTDPLHPYSRLLLEALPTTNRRKSTLPMIAGQMPPPGARVAGCRFRERCPIAVARCASEAPPLTASDDGRSVRCWRPGELLADRAA